MMKYNTPIDPQLQILRTGTVNHIGIVKRKFWKENNNFIIVIETKVSLRYEHIIFGFHKNRRLATNLIIIWSKFHIFYWHPFFRIRLMT